MGSVVRRSLALALVALFVSVGVTFASNGGDRLGGDRLTVTPFHTVGTCAPTAPAWGLRIVNTGPHGFVKDVEQCLVPAHLIGLEPGKKYSIFDPAIGGWFSDYDAGYTDPTDPVCEPFSVDVGFCYHVAVSGTLVVTKAWNNMYVWNVITNY